MSYDVYRLRGSAWTQIAVLPRTAYLGPAAGAPIAELEALASYLGALPASWNGYQMLIYRTTGPTPVGGPPSNTVAYWRALTLPQLATIFAVKLPGPVNALAYAPSPSAPQLAGPGAWLVGGVAGVAQAAATAAQVVDATVGSTVAGASRHLDRAARWSVGARLSRSARVGATAESLPDPAAADWGWQAQQAYAVGTARRVNELGEELQNQGSFALVLATAVALAAGAVSAWGFSEIARTRRRA